jgi:hypothetical protein
MTRITVARINLNALAAARPATAEQQTRTTMMIDQVENRDVGSRSDRDLNLNLAHHDVDNPADKFALRQVASESGPIAGTWQSPAVAWQCRPGRMSQAARVPPARDGRP